LKPYSIIIVEDDANTLDRLRRAVDAEPKLTVVGTSSSIAEAKKLIDKNPPTVLLTDLGLPDGNGRELISYTYQHYPNVLSMVLSLFGDEQNVVNAIVAGAKGYVLKKNEDRPISESVLQLIDGASPISASIARYLLVKLQDNNEDNKTVEKSEPASSGNLLTGRETEVLELVSLGYRSQEIANQLGISYHTVVHHIRIVYDKLAVTSRAQAIHKASKIGLIKGG
jgi:DNA-binding NarL/FixJ family response regulator